MPKTHRTRDLGYSPKVLCYVPTTDTETSTTTHVGGQKKEGVLKSQKPFCVICAQTQIDYAHYCSDEQLADPNFTDDLGHYWLCKECDRQEIREVRWSHDYEEPDIFDWYTGKKIVY